MSVEVSESSSLLGQHAFSVKKLSSTEKQDSTCESVKLVALAVVAVIFGVASMLVGWKSFSVTGHPTHNMDAVSFDRIFHVWESNLYKRTQLVPVLLPVGKSPIHVTDPKDELIYLNHSKAFDMFLSTKPSLTRDFYLYQQGWDAQINQAYCGVASTMAVLNSLRGKITLPQDPIYSPFPWATQTTLIRNDCVRQNLYDVDKMQNLFWGLGLEMSTTLLNCHLQGSDYTATAYPVHPDVMTVEDLRTILMDALHNEDTRIIINYDRGGISQGPMGHGHFSPIGGYNYEKDAFLIMDMAKYKYPPVWVPTSRLFDGVSTWDSCAVFDYPDHPFDISSSDQIEALLGCKAMNRGYILITKDDNHTSTTKV